MAEFCVIECMVDVRRIRPDLLIHVRTCAVRALRQSLEGRRSLGNQMEGLPVDGVDRDLPVSHRPPAGCCAFYPIASVAVNPEPSMDGNLAIRCSCECYCLRPKRGGSWPFKSTLTAMCYATQPDGLRRPRARPFS